LVAKQYSSILCSHPNERGQFCSNLYMQFANTVSLSDLSRLLAASYGPQGRLTSTTSAPSSHVTSAQGGSLVMMAAIPNDSHDLNESRVVRKHNQKSSLPTFQKSIKTFIDFASDQGDHTVNKDFGFTVEVSDSPSYTIDGMGDVVDIQGPFLDLSQKIPLGQLLLRWLQSWDGYQNVRNYEQKVTDDLNWVVKLQFAKDLTYRIVCNTF